MNMNAMMTFGWLGMLLGVAVLVLLVVGLVRLLSKPEEDALSVAERRYARGEISREKFNELKRTLS